MHRYPLYLLVLVGLKLGDPVKYLSNFNVCLQTLCTTDVLYVSDWCMFTTDVCFYMFLTPCIYRLWPSHRSLDGLDAHLTPLLSSTIP